MHPFINTKRKVIFWWSAKCGCTTVKSIMLESMIFDFVNSKIVADEDVVRASINRIVYKKDNPIGSMVDAFVSDFVNSNFVNSVHCVLAGSLICPSLGEASQFRNILFVRDPFQRFVSGVIDKHIEGNFSSVYRPKSFSDAAENIHLLESHHFAPQTSAAYLPELEYDKVFDIRSIDFDYISEILEMRVTPRKLHNKTSYSLPCIPNLSHLDYDQLAEIKSKGLVPGYDCFYDDRSRELVRDYYKGDIELMRRLLPESAF